jgi:hypothetical protein
MKMIIMVMRKKKVMNSLYSCATLQTSSLKLLNGLWRGLFQAKLVSKITRLEANPSIIGLLEKGSIIDLPYWMILLLV